MLQARRRRDSFGHASRDTELGAAGIPSDSGTIYTQRVTWTELFTDVIVAAEMPLIYGSRAEHLSRGERLGGLVLNMLGGSKALSVDLLLVSVGALLLSGATSQNHHKRGISLPTPS